MDATAPLEQLPIDANQWGGGFPNRLAYGVRFSGAQRP
jgi:hypothetical protein